VEAHQTEGARAFIQTLSEAPELDVWQAGRDEAVSRVRKGRAAAYVVLQPGFGEARRRVFWGEPAGIELGLDPGRGPEGEMLKGILTKHLFEGMREIFTNRQAMRAQVQDALTETNDGPDGDASTRAALRLFLPALDHFLATMPESTDEGFRGFEPIRIETTLETRETTSGGPPRFAITFPQGILWGFLACTATFAISLVCERTRGTLYRLRLAPIGRMRILAGKALAAVFTNLVVGVMLLALGVLAFGIRPQSYALLAMALACTALSFSGIVLLLSVLGKTESAAGGLSWAVMLVMALLGGGMVPLAFMPSLMRTLSHASPVKWGILALEGAIWRGFTLTEMLLPCAVLLAVGAACFLIGVRAFRWTEQS